MKIALALAALLCTAAHVHAQQVLPALPDSTAQRIAAFYNSPTTTRLTGDAHVAAGAVVRGDIAALSGTLTIEGTVEGNVIVINGVLVLRDNARITGYAQVTGGSIRAFDVTGVAGGASVYREPLRYRHDASGISAVPAEDDAAGLAAGRDFGFGRTELLVAAQGAYNRVEGMPIAIGPRIRSTGAHPTNARALLIVRTANADEVDPKRFGYELRAEQSVVPSIGLTLGARLFAEIAAVETLGLTNREAALATFVLHRDYRDHYEREGWNAYARMTAPGRAWQLTLEYRDEEHLATPPSDPLTLLRTTEGWRPEASVAEGALRSIVAAIRYDTRNDDRDPSVGWLIDAQLERGLGGGIGNPALPDPTTPDEPRSGRTGFSSATVDIRRYARLSPYARLAVRVVGAGSIDARALPPQRQHTLGGAGSLPGYSAFAFDCGARDSTVTVRGEPFHRYYGCDRVALVQLEYQAAFPLARRLAESAGLGSRIGQAVRWIAFFNAGRAWNEPGAGDGREGGNDDFSADAGVGIRFGPLGAFWALPLGRGSSDVRFTVRLDPRI
jgi:hypothetical protein